MNPVIAVITPTKNRLPLLCETMDSVQRQSFETWEHIIVDDGSDDGTAEEVARRAAADPRFRYHQRTGDKSGVNVCRNLGVSESRADLTVFLDSDDLLAPDSLARRVAIMGRNEDLDFVTFQTVTFQTGVAFQNTHLRNIPPRNTHLRRELDAEREVIIGDDLLRFLFFECPWSITGPVWRKASLLRLGLFDKSLLSWEDIDLHIRAIAAGCHYLRFPEVDHYVRQHFDPTRLRIEQRRSPRHLSAANGILEKFERVVSDGPGMSWVRQRALCSLYFFVAEQWLRTGSLSAALRSWRRIRQRALGSRVLHLSGAALLVIQALGAPGRSIGGRLTHKWKGWMRLRTNPDFHPIQKAPSVDVPATFMPLSLPEKSYLKLNPEGFASRISKPRWIARLRRCPLKEGDVIYSVNKVEECSMALTAMGYILLCHKPGEIVELGLIRGEQRLTQKIKLYSSPPPLLLDVVRIRTILFQGSVSPAQ